MYQQASYWGFNEPSSLLAPYAFFLFMFIGGAMTCLVMRCIAPSDSSAGRKYTSRQYWLCAGIAGFTVTDNVVSIVAITFIGGMLYSIVYGWVVVATALIRRFFLKRNIGIWQWAGVFCVSAGLTIAGAAGGEG